MTLSVLLVGHVCFDKREGKVVLGGPSMYIVPVLQYLFDKIDILTSAQSSFPFPKNTNVHLIPSDKNTVFSYSENCQEDRCMRLEERAENLDRFPDTSYDAVIVSGIAGEIHSDSLPALSKLGKVSIIDMQTLVREFDDSGNLKIVKDKFIEKAISDFTFTKASDQEVSKLRKGLIITSARRVRIQTDRIIVQDTLYNDDPIDTTGSGDVFLAGFLTAYILSEDVELSMKYGVEFAAVNVRYSGIPPSEAYRSVFDKLRSETSKYS